MTLNAIKANVLKLSVLTKVDKSWLSQLAWLFAGEGISRITRIVTAIVLSRFLTPLEFGLAALVLASDEFIRVFNRNGIGLKIIQAADSELDVTCQGVYKINWVLNIALALLQITLAAPIAAYFNYPELNIMLQVLAISYVIYPLAMVQVYRVQRRQDMRTTSLMFGLQVGLDNLLTAALVLMGFGVWSVIIPKVLVAPVWVYGYYHADSWRFNASRASMSIKQVWRFSRDVLAVEVLRTARLSWDRLLIGASLGIETLGIYFFAVNAGSGMALSLIKAFNTAVMPRICRSLRSNTRKKSDTVNNNHSLQRDCLSAIGFYSLFIVPLILAQLILAPWYVPLIFGEQWQSAITVLMILCGAMIFQGGIEACSQVLRAHNQTGLDLRITICVAAATLTAVIVGCQFSILWVAQLTLIAQITAFTALGAYLYLNESKEININNNKNNLIGAVS